MLNNLTFYDAYLFYKEVVALTPLNHPDTSCHRRNSTLTVTDLKRRINLRGATP